MTPESAKQLRREIERISREALPELRDALQRNLPEEDIVALLAARVSTGLSGGEVVDVPAAAVGAVAQTENNDGQQPTIELGQILAQLVLLNDHMGRVREIAEAWAESNGGGGG